MKTQKIGLCVTYSKNIQALSRVIFLKAVISQAVENEPYSNAMAHASCPSDMITEFDPNNLEESIRRLAEEDDGGLPGVHFQQRFILRLSTSVGASHPPY